MGVLLTIVPAQDIKMGRSGSVKLGRGYTCTIDEWQGREKAHPKVMVKRSIQLVLLVSL